MLENAQDKKRLPSEKWKLWKSFIDPNLLILVSCVFCQDGLQIGSAVLHLLRVHGVQPVEMRRQGLKFEVAIQSIVI